MSHPRSAPPRRRSLSIATAAALGLAPVLAFAQPQPPAARPTPAGSSAAPAPASAAAAPAKDAADPIVARVGSQVLHRSDVLAAQKQLPPQLQAMPLQQIYPLLLDQMVNILVLADAGRQEHLQDDPEVKSRIEAFTNRSIEEVYVNRLIDPEITDAKLKARYEQAVKENPAKEEVQASHILVSSEAAAKDIIAQLDKGADFAQLAREKSTDPGSKNGGDLGWFTREDMVPEFADAAFSLNPGQYTKTPVKTQFGYHVIKVTGKRQAPPPTFEEMRPQLVNEISRQIIDAKVKNLRAHDKVELFALDGAPSQQPGLSLAPDPSTAPAAPGASAPAPAK